MRRTTAIRVVCTAALLCLLPLCALAGERWTRFDTAPLVRGSLDGRNHIFSMGVERGEGCRILINGAPLVVADPWELTVFHVPREAVRKEEEGWSVGIEQLTPVVGAHMTVTALAGDKAAYHIWWPGHDIRLKATAPPPRPAPAPAAEQPPQPPPAPVSSSPAPMEPLALGLRWRVPPHAGRITPPVVTRVPAPPELLLQFQPLGKAYRIEFRDSAPAVPVEAEIPLPPRAFAGSKRIALLESEEGGFSVLRPLTTDPVRHAVTVAVDRSSTWTPTVWSPGYPAAEVTGTVKVRSGCEETPSAIHFEVTRTDDGQYVNFPVESTAPGSYRLEPPIPQSLFGTYAFRGLRGASEHFLFGHLEPDPEQEIVDRKSYVQDLKLVPVSGRLEGRVVGLDGGPVAGARISLLGKPEDAPSVTTRADGRFTLERIPLDPPSGDPSRIYPVRYRLEKAGNSCRQAEGAVALTAGVTTRTTLIFDCNAGEHRKGR